MKRNAENILYCIQTAEGILVSTAYYPGWNWSRNLGLAFRLTIGFVKGGIFRGSHFLVVLRKLPTETDCSVKPTQANASSLTHFGTKNKLF